MPGNIRNKLTKGAVVKIDMHSLSRQHRKGLAICPDRLLGGKFEVAEEPRKSRFSPATTVVLKPICDDPREFYVSVPIHALEIVDRDNTPDA